MVYTKKEVDEIINQIKINMVTNVDGINDANIGSILDQFTTAFSVELGVQYDDLDVIFNGTRISTATETDLEELGSLLGVTRNTGSNAGGVVTFSRNSPAPSDFVIASGSMVSTQPGTDVQDYTFVTETTTTFESAIEDEAHTFIDGIYEYRADQRFIDSLTAIDGLVSAAPTTFVLDTDYSLTKDYTGIVIDIDDYTLLDDCETADWVQGDEADNETLNATTFFQGTNSLNLLKSGTSTTVMSYTKTLGAAEILTSNSMFVDLYIKDSAALAKITNVELYIGSNGAITNAYGKVFLAAALAVGWNKLIVNINSANVIAGTPDSSNLDFLKIEINTVIVGDTFAAGDLLMDHWFYSTYDATTAVKDIIQWDRTATKPDDASALAVDYVPLSLDLTVVASLVGDESNAQTGKVIYKVTNISSIDRIYNYAAFTGGIDLETDDEYRVRIQDASELQNTATILAIKTNVEALQFVSSATVVDRPETTAPEELFTYSTSIDKYSLTNWVAISDANLTIGDTTGASDYTRDTDFELTIENEIDWSIGGTAPSDTNPFYVNYHYNKLGFFSVTVAGTSGALTVEQLAEVTTLVDTLKSAGIIASVAEPSYISVAVTAAVTVGASFDATATKALVDTAIQDYINALGIGGDVLLAGVIAAGMGVTGVENINVTDIESGGAADFAISITESAINGTHVIT